MLNWFLSWSYTVFTLFSFAKSRLILAIATPPKVRKVTHSLIIPFSIYLIDHPQHVILPKDSGHLTVSIKGLTESVLYSFHLLCHSDYLLHHITYTLVDTLMGIHIILHTDECIQYVLIDNVEMKDWEKHVFILNG